MIVSVAMLLKEDMDTSTEEASIAWAPSEEQATASPPFQRHASPFARTTHSPPFSRIRAFPRSRSRSVQSRHTHPSTPSRAMSPKPAWTLATIAQGIQKSPSPGFDPPPKGKGACPPGSKNTKTIGAGAARAATARISTEPCERPRGRPPKRKAEEESAELPPMRARGRPRKNPLPDTPPESPIASGSRTEAPKRERGRPRKEGVVTDVQMEGSSPSRTAQANTRSKRQRDDDSADEGDDQPARKVCALLPLS
ncbi:hypothetical protein C8Q76DRAFT_256057 [Earliella scabrosa]|nr:hypothetical protein C8Q76DRAFT_256057 [Earliella scabrosa]